MSIDLNPVVPAVTPATEAKVYPLKWIRKLLLEGGPESMRAYAELAPYRRLYVDVPVMADVDTPVLDPEGNPVMDENGVPLMQPVPTPTGETVSTLVGAELKTPEVDGDITTLDVDNILSAAQADAAGEDMVEATLNNFLMAGGNLVALTMACVTLTVQQIGKMQGKLS